MIKDLGMPHELTTGIVLSIVIMLCCLWLVLCNLAACHTACSKLPRPTDCDLHLHLLLISADQAGVQVAWKVGHPDLG